MPGRTKTVSPSIPFRVIGFKVWTPDSFPQDHTPPAEHHTENSLQPEHTLITDGDAEHPLWLHPQPTEIDQPLLSSQPSRVNDSTRPSPSASRSAHSIHPQFSGSPSPVEDQAFTHPRGDVPPLNPQYYDGSLASYRQPYELAGQPEPNFSPHATPNTTPRQTPPIMKAPSKRKDKEPRKIRPKDPSKARSKLSKALILKRKPVELANPTSEPAIIPRLTKKSFIISNKTTFAESEYTLAPTDPDSLNLLPFPGLSPLLERSLSEELGRHNMLEVIIWKEDGTKRPCRVEGCNHIPAGKVWDKETWNRHQTKHLKNCHVGVHYVCPAEGCAHGYPRWDSCKPHMLKCKHFNEAQREAAQFCNIDWANRNVRIVTLGSGAAVNRAKIQSFSFIIDMRQPSTSAQGSFGDGSSSSGSTEANQTSSLKMDAREVNKSGQSFFDGPSAPGTRERSQGSSTELNRVETSSSIPGSYGPSSQGFFDAPCASGSASDLETRWNGPSTSTMVEQSDGLSIVPGENEAPSFDWQFSTPSLEAFPLSNDPYSLNSSNTNTGWSTPIETPGAGPSFLPVDAQSDSPMISEAFPWDMFQSSSPEIVTPDETELYDDVDDLFMRDFCFEK